MRMKFVTFAGAGGEQIIIFPEVINHRAFAVSIEKLSYGTMYPISAGFVEDGICSGKSLSLDMYSRGHLDTDLVIQLIGGE
jgi:hypothetical protein